MSLVRVPIAGVALFDNADTLTSGWYSAGDQAIRFSSPAALPQSLSTPDGPMPVFWITNASYGEYHLANLNGVGFVRQPNFFKVSLRMISNELGINMQTCDTREAVVTLSQVVGRAWAFAAKVWPEMLPCETLVESLQIHINLKDQPDFALLEPVMASSFQENSSVTGEKWESGAVNLVLVPNRVRHVANVTSFGVPSGVWTIRRDINTVDKALEIESPVFVECDVTWRGAELANLCAYGIQSIGKNQTVRQWVAQPELMFLAEHATSIKVMAATTWEMFVMPPQLPDAFFEDSFTSLSYSAGIVAESFLGAIASKRYSKKHKKSFHPARAIWLRAVDRALSFAQAKLLYDSGIRVVDYGFGSVGVRAFPHEIDEVRGVAAECGFMIVSRKGGGSNE